MQSLQLNLVENETPQAPSSETPRSVVLRMAQKPPVKKNNQISKPPPRTPYSPPSPGSSVPVASERSLRGVGVLSCALAPPASPLLRFSASPLLPVSLPLLPLSLPVLR